MVSGDAFVVTDGEFAPEGEAGCAAGGVPGASGAGEVFAGAGVVHGERAAGRGDHGFDAANRFGDIEVDAVHRCDGVVLGGLHPLAEGVFAFDGAVVVGFEYFDGLGDARAGLDALGGLPHFGLDAPEFFPAPLVGFFEVEHESVEVAGGASVAVGADGVALGRAGQIGVIEPVGELAVGAGGVARAVVEVVSQRRVLLRAFCGEVVKEAVGGGPDAGLFD